MDAVFYCGDHVLGNLLTRLPQSPSVLILELTEGLAAYQRGEHQAFVAAEEVLAKIQGVLNVPVELLAQASFPVGLEEVGDVGNDTGELDENRENAEEGNDWFICMDTPTGIFGLGLIFLWREEYDNDTGIFILDHCRVEVYAQPAHDLFGDDIGISTSASFFTAGIFEM